LDPQAAQKMAWNGFTPEKASFFELRDKDHIYFQGAARFEDSMESDFRKKESKVLASEFDLLWVERSTEKQGAMKWMTAFILGLLWGSWFLQKRETS